MGYDRVPAFQIFPKDYLASSAIVSMALDERGAYITLAALCVTGCVKPGDERRALGLSWPAFRRFQPNIEDLFYVRNGRLWPRNTPWMHVGWKGRGPASRLLRRLMEYWGSACVYCGNEFAPLEIEHIVPKARGGSDDISNLTVACQPCNNAKRTKTASEFGHPEIERRRHCLSGA